MDSEKKRLQYIKSALDKASGVKVTMRTRLFAFLIALVVLMVMGVIAVLLIAGPLTTGRGEAEKFIEKEFSDVYRGLSAQLGDTSIQLVSLSESLSKSIENQLLSKNIRINELQSHPEILEDITGYELSRLLLALERAKCSSVFMILEATVNPSLENSENSRAGLCVRNSEPELSGPSMDRYFVRGFPGIAHKNGLLMISNWDLEFDVSGRDFFHLPIKKHGESGLPLSRLYYWNLESVIADSPEATLLCSIPLVDSNGAAFGVCGFEISAMKFQSNFKPDDGEFKHIFCMLSEFNENDLNPENALFSGNHISFSGKEDKLPLFISAGSGFNTYKPENGKPLIGLHKEINMYPSDSAFSDRHFALSLLIPKEEMDMLTTRQNMRLVIICVILLVLGSGVSLFISEKYLSPIMSAFNTIRSHNLGGIAETNILEIDQLIEQIKAQRTIKGPLPDNLFEDFISRVKTLTPTEKEIFRHYLSGKSNNEILSVMFISMSTLKTHNSHIYSKLNVSSKDELMLYVELINKSGLSSEIS